MEKKKALDKISSVLESINQLDLSDRRSAEFKKWRRNAQVAIRNIFGDESQHIKDFDRVRYSTGLITPRTSEADFAEAFKQGLAHARAVLESMLEEIGDYWSDSEISSNDIRQPIEIPTSELGNKVFVVHGRDVGLKDRVARFISKLGLEPIILHEQPNQGRTIIEKFSDESAVSFAVVLLTPDDVGALAEEPDSLNARARQNVVFEFGFFIGKLGRTRVCGLVNGEIELPSDYDGVLYIQIDGNSSWKFDLVKELKAVGFDVDANLAL